MIFDINIKSSLIGILYVLLLLCVSVSSSYAALGTDYSVVCGTTTQGEPMKCNLSTHRCYRCKHAVGLIFREIRYSYSCLPASADPPKSCEIASSGGGTGDYDVRILGLKISGLHKE